jgi:hypothetical protein
VVSDDFFYELVAKSSHGTHPDWARLALGERGADELALEPDGIEQWGQRPPMTGDGRRKPNLDSMARGKNRPAGRFRQRALA